MGSKRNIGLSAVGFGLTVIGAGLIYFSSTLSRAIVEIPDRIEVVHSTQEEAAEYPEVIDVVLEEVEAVRLTIPIYILQAGELTASIQQAEQKGANTGMRFFRTMEQGIESGEFVL